MEAAPADVVVPGWRSTRAGRQIGWGEQDVVSLVAQPFSNTCLGRLMNVFIRDGVQFSMVIACNNAQY